MAERFVPNAGRDAMHCVCTPAQAYKCAELVSRMCGTGVQNVRDGCPECPKRKTVRFTVIC